MFELTIPILLFLIVFCSIILLAKKWELFSNFFHTHYTYFNIIFVIIYALEQALFIILSGLKYLDSFTLIGLFALIVLTTATLQGIMMESRNKKLSNSLELSSQQYAEKTSEMKNRYNSMSSKLKTYIEMLENEINILTQKRSSKK